MVSLDKMQLVKAILLVLPEPPDITVHESIVQLQAVPLSVTPAA